MPSPEKFQALAAADRAAAGRALAAVKKRLLVPHPGQLLVLQSAARFRVLVAGRRWGKTKLGARETIRKAIEHSNGTIWWVANRWKNTRRGYKEVVKQLPPQLLAKPAPLETSNELVLRLVNGTNIEFYSGESPDSLAGAGVDFVVVDEAALIKAQTWQQLIRPTLMDTAGEALVISTPRGRNWFYDEFRRGEGAHPDYDSWQFPQTTNPYIPASETEDARMTLPDIVFRQEIMAEFVSSAASIFNWTEDRVAPGIAEPDGHVVLGVDLGKKEDFTVLTAVNSDTRVPVYWDRFNTIRWGEQKELIVNAVHDLMDRGAAHVEVVVDATGLGDVVVDDLEDMGLDVLPVKFTPAWKALAVRRLAADLEQGRAYLLPDELDEFETYEYELTDKGVYTFAAAIGHDDKVSAKLLQHWAIAGEGYADVKEVKWAGIEDDDEDSERDISAVEIEADDPEDIMSREEAWS